FRRRVLLLIDNNSTSKHNLDVALRSVEKFIHDRFSGGAYDWSIVSVGRGARVILPQTSDKAAIHTALDQIRRAAPAMDDRGQPLPFCNSTPPGAVPRAAGLSLTETQTACTFAADIARREEMMNSSGINRSIIESVRAF